MGMSSSIPRDAAGVKFNKTSSFDLTGCIIGKFVWSLLVHLIAALGSHDTAPLQGFSGAVWSFSSFVAHLYQAVFSLGVKQSAPEVKAETA